MSNNIQAYYNPIKDTNWLELTRKVYNKEFANNSMINKAAKAVLCPLSLVADLFYNLFVKAPVGIAKLTVGNAKTYFHNRKVRKAQQQQPSWIKKLFCSKKAAAGAALSVLISGAAYYFRGFIPFI